VADLVLYTDTVMLEFMSCLPPVSASLSKARTRLTFSAFAARCLLSRSLIAGWNVVRADTRLPKSGCLEEIDYLPDSHVPINTLRGFMHAQQTVRGERLQFTTYTHTYRSLPYSCWSS